MNRILVNILIWLVLIGLAIATAYVYFQSQQEIQNNALFARHFTDEAALNPAPVLIDQTSPKSEYTSGQASQASSTVGSASSTPVIKDWLPYQSNSLGMVFQYPPSGHLQNITGEYWPDVPSHDGYVINVDDFPDLRYETLTRKQIFIGIDKDRTTFASCTEGETAKKNRPDGMVVHQVPIAPNCALDGCAVGYHSKIYKAGICYTVTVFGLQANPTKLYDQTDPKIHLADLQNTTAKNRLSALADSLVSTIVWK